MTRCRVVIHLPAYPRTVRLNGVAVTVNPWSPTDSATSIQILPAARRREYPRRTRNPGLDNIQLSNRAEQTRP